MDKSVKQVQDIAPVDESLHPVSWQPKPVYQFGKDGKFIQSYRSKGQACRVAKINKSSLDACLKGHQRTAGGCQWKYAD